YRAACSRNLAERARDSSSPLSQMLNLKGCGSFPPAAARFFAENRHLDYDHIQTPAAKQCPDESSRASFMVSPRAEATAHTRAGWTPRRAAAGPGQRARTANPSGS